MQCWLIWANYYLVGGWATHLKNISQIGNLPQVGVKVNNIWNHHLAIIPKPELRVFWDDLGWKNAIICPNLWQICQKKNLDPPQKITFKPNQPCLKPNQPCLLELWKRTIEFHLMGMLQYPYDFCWRGEAGVLVARNVHPKFIAWKTIKHHTIKLLLSKTLFIIFLLFAKEPPNLLPRYPEIDMFSGQLIINP